MVPTFATSPAGIPAVAGDNGGNQALDLLEDVLRPGGPDERPRVAVGLGEEAVDRRLQLNERAEHAAFEPALGELGEETLDGVQPRGRGRGEVEGPARVPLQPGQDLRV